MRGRMTIMVRLIDRPTHGSRSVKAGAAANRPGHEVGTPGVPGLGLGHK
jgi:hypothetical protein